MERGSLVIKEIAWRVRGSQTPKRSHEETIGDTSPSVASSVLSRPSYYSLHSSHSGSLSFPLLHSLTPSSSLSSSLFQSLAWICSAWLFCTIIRSELHLQLVCVLVFHPHMKQLFLFLLDERQIQEVFGYEVHGIPSGGVTVVGAKAGILGILQAPLRLWTWVRHEISCLAPWHWLVERQETHFLLGMRRGGKKLQSRRETTWHGERKGAPAWPWPCGMIEWRGMCEDVVYHGCKGDWLRSTDKSRLLFWGGARKPLSGFQWHSSLPQHHIFFKVSGL